MRATGILGLLLASASRVRSAAVFAHFMVGNAENYTLGTWETDIGLAQEAHIDAFALNIAYNDSTAANSVSLAFQAASSKGFKLFFSFDYAGGGPWPADSVRSVASPYLSLATYFTYNGKPLISTFEGTQNAQDWETLKHDLGCFFLPDYSSLGADAAKTLGVADGLFSWAAWAWGNQAMDTYVDASYRNYLEDLPYMMPVSPWFYTNLPGYNKNWLWRGDHAWYDRWTQIWWYKPELVEIISWNDYGESHYIGPIYDFALGAMRTGRAPFDYVTGYPHDGWRLVLPYVIDMYKLGTATVTQEGVVGWYRRNPAGACSDGGTSGNTASQLQIEFPAAAVLYDEIFFSAVLASPADISVTVNGQALPASWQRTPEGGVGIYHGSVSFNGHSGPVTISVKRNGATVATFTGPSVETGCVGGVNNFNAVTGSGTSSQHISMTPSITLKDMVCINGTGANNFAGLCSFACQFGVYCPPQACVCLELGSVPGTEPKATHPNGYPIAGEDAAYSGLCSYDCSHGYCPPSACGTASEPLITPDVSDFETPYCHGGTGEGNLQGLCQFACAYGFCPIAACDCTATGAGLPSQPPATTTILGLPAAGLPTQTYSAICSYACEHGYCPPAACQPTQIPPVSIRLPDPDDVCSMLFYTGDKTQDAETWSDSGAQDWLYDFLGLDVEPSQTGPAVIPDPHDWTIRFFEQVINCGATPGGTTINCMDLGSTTCTPPGTTPCSSYCPKEAYFIHASIANIFSAFNQLHEAFQDIMLIEMASVINKAVDYFGTPAPDVLFATLSGILSTLGGGALVIADALPAGEVFANVGDVLSFFSAMFSVAGAVTDDPGAPLGTTLTEQLGDIMNALYKSVNRTETDVLSPDVAASGGAVTAAWSVWNTFQHGMWLDQKTINAAVAFYKYTVNSTLSQFMAFSAMASGKGANYCLLVNSANDSNLALTESECTKGPGALWYDNNCIGFGTWEQDSEAGQGVTWVQTAALTKDKQEALGEFVPDINATLINNYECNKNGGGAAQWSGISFNAGEPNGLPACFWSLPSYYWNMNLSNS